MRLTIRKDKGFILLSVISVVLILILIIIPLISWSVNALSWTARSFRAFQALNLADAGAEFGIWEIVHNGASFSGWSGANPKTATISAFTDNEGNVMGDIEVSVESLSGASYLITSSGFIPDFADPVTQKTVKVKVFPLALFNSAIFGYDSVILRGSANADSYNSGDGPYIPGMGQEEADVGSNGNISLEGSAVVNGDLFIGPDGSITGDIPSHITGADYYMGEDVEIVEPPFDQTYFTALPSQGNLVVAGHDTPVIAPGDYRYESISIEAHAVLTINNNTRLYVHNDIYIAGQAQVLTEENVQIFIGGNANFAGRGIVNISNIPGNLQIYGINSGSSLNFSGSSDFYGAIYAPSSDIYMTGEADYYGAISGGAVDLSGEINFHYDESLSEAGPTNGYNIAYWQED